MEVMIEYQSENGDYGVKFPESILSFIHKLCAESNLLETGGILIGKYSDDLKWAEVYKATILPSGSRRTMMSFVRKSATVLRILDRAWEERMYYLGEWHYHPNASPNPSRVDRRTIRRFASNKKLHCPEPIMLIIGGNPTAWQEHVSLFTNGKEIILNRRVP